MNEGSWHYSPDHGQLSQVIETQTIWGEPTCRAWLPGSDFVVRLRAATHRQERMRMLLLIRLDGNRE